MMRLRIPLALVLPLLALVLLPSIGSAQAFPLSLVVEDVESVADAEVNVIVRTLAPLALASGTIAIEAREREGAPIQPFAALVSATAFSETGDAVADAAFDVATQRAEVTFSSASATLNTAFGPLVVLRFQLAPGLAEDLRFDLWPDPDLELLDPDGLAVATLAARGRLRIVVAEPEVGLGGLGGEFFPGETVISGPVTADNFAIGGGTIEILYDTAFADGAPVPFVDPRYGSIVLDSFTEVAPGHLLIEFHSPDGDLNTDLHGLLLSVAIPSRADIVPPTTFAFDLGPATALTDPLGNPILLEVESDPVEFLVPEILFEGLFEGANLMEWWNFQL